MIKNLLITLTHFLSERPNRSITVGQSDKGIWLVADDDMEVAALIIIRYMIQNKYESIDHIHKLTNGNNHTLVYHDNLATFPK